MSNEVSKMLEAVPLDLEHTSTMALAREMHRASWRHNPGRMTVDIPLFDNLPELGKFHLLETAYAAETLLDQYDHEEEKLLTWNLAEVMYTAYTHHPASDLPPLPWVSAPTDVGVLWYRMASDVLKEWYLKKGLPRHKGWLDFSMRSE